MAACRAAESAVTRSWPQLHRRSCEGRDERGEAQRGGRLILVASGDSESAEHQEWSCHAHHVCNRALASARLFQETFTTGARKHEQHPWCRAVVLAQSARVRGRRAPVFPTRSGVGGSLHALPSNREKQRKGQKLTGKKGLTFASFLLPSLAHHEWWHRNRRIGRRRGGQFSQHIARIWHPQSIPRSTSSSASL